jgi:hypothetical protein
LSFVNRWTAPRFESLASDSFYLVSAPMGEAPNASMQKELNMRKVHEGECIPQELCAKDMVPPGTFHGADLVPPGTFHSSN